MGEDFSHEVTMAAQTFDNQLLVFVDGRVVKVAKDDTIKFDGPVEFQQDLTVASLEVSGDASVGGNLTVAGDIISQGEVSLVVSDTFIDLDAGYTGTTARAAGFTANIKKATGFSALTATDFVAGVAGTSAPKFTCSAAVTTLAEGDIVQVSGCTVHAENNGLFIVKTVAGSDVTIKGVGGTAVPSYAPFAHNQFSASTGETASIVKVDLAVVAVADGVHLKQDSVAIGVGLLCSAYIPNATDALFDGAWSPVGYATLQDAYDHGNTITLKDTLDLSVTMPTTGTAAIELQANDSSYFEAVGADLDLKTTTSGTLSVSSAEDMSVSTAGGALDIDSNGGALSLNSDDVINIGNDAVNENINIGTDGSRTLTLGGASATLDLQSGAGGASVDSTGAIELTADAASKFEVADADITIAAAGPAPAGAIVISGEMSGDFSANLPALTGTGAKVALLTESDLSSAGKSLELLAAGTIIGVAKDNVSFISAANDVNQHEAAIRAIQQGGGSTRVALETTGDVEFSSGLDLSNGGSYSLRMTAAGVLESGGDTKLDQVNIETAGDIAFTSGGQSLTMHLEGSQAGEIVAEFKAMNADPAGVAKVYIAAEEGVKLDNGSNTPSVEVKADMIEIQNNAAGHDIKIGTLNHDGDIYIGTDATRALYFGENGGSTTIAMHSDGGTFDMSATGQTMQASALSLDFSASAGASMSAGTDLDLSGVASVDLTLNADDATAKTLRVEALNAGAGDAQIEINAKGSIQLKADGAHDKGLFIKDSNDDALMKAESSAVSIGSDTAPVIFGQQGVGQASVGTWLTAPNASGIVEGNILYIASNGKLAKADADAALGAVRELVGVSLESPNAGPEGEIMVASVPGTVAWMKFSSAPATVGEAVYLSGTAGEATQTVPTSGRVYRLGILLSSTASNSLYKVLYLPSFVADLA